ncbi:folate-binding protein YgfZ [Nitratireductor rhodophyticola]|uniref:CAF17-like 4Fe-4S cluster assembly/insertion protein YgfZ n=1 Tax=Nitratireductor rhodophyticola TaxID=2854036 RepID=UPI002AC9DBA2|nr:folate-binding protein YgfZ [Nitratireductor rhodophyticola]MEC9244292.1 folate-binding protein YgfZ [Pseudomonadota bacterium]WPZ14058.1 folate-binding protein YgfZ [Nitratireductor rhodophyticola]
MPTCHLDNRALFQLQGPEAEHFLQNVITTDLSALEDGQCRPSALLAPQGKILFDFLVSRAGSETLRIECRADIAADLVKRLTLYKLRAKVDISEIEQRTIAVSWQNDSDSSENDSTLLDCRFPKNLNVRRHYGETPEADSTRELWDELRIANAVAESDSDFALGDAFPHDVLYDQNGGVGLKKGCFVGQEVVSRMHHRGTARRRLLIVSGASALPAPGTELRADGKPLGTLGTVSSHKALAIVRIDRVKDAIDAGIPVVAGDTPVTFAIPQWAGFTFPESTESAG